MRVTPSPNSGRGQEGAIPQNKFDAIALSLSIQLFCAIMLVINRGVAQSGSALAWGARGPGFKSLRPDRPSPIDL